MNITINNNTSFNAKLDYSEMKYNKARWVKVAKLFEKRTTQYPNETFNIFNYDFDKRGVIRFDYFTPGKERIVTDEGYIKPETGLILRKLPDKKLAKYLKKLFIIQKKADKIEESAVNFDQKYNLYETMPGELLDKFWRNFFDIKKEYINLLLKKDPIIGKEGAVRIP